MSRLFLFILAYCFGIGFVFSQGGNNADCLTSILWTGQKISVESVNGPGSNIEITGNERGNEMYFTEEKNTVWIRFIAPVDGELTFDLVPDVPSDDWDFMLYKAQVNQCPAIKGKEIKPIRSNLATNDMLSGGRTGLDLKSEKEFQSAGDNPNFSQWVEVANNDHYFLVINIVENHGNGFKLNIKIDPFTTKQATDIDDDDGFGFVDMTKDAVDEKKISVKFILLDQQTKKPISCHTNVKGINWTVEDLEIINKSEFDVAVPSDKYFYINVKKDGYTFSTEKFKANEELNNSVQTIYVSPMKAGSHIVLKEIVFRENTTHMLPSSVNALEQLIAFMEEYPSAKIEIQGHVNAPGMSNDGKVKKFSLKRASQIKLYLVDAGISGNRIQIKGMGNEFMIYPNPSDYEQEKLNRRVEIEILSL